MSVVIGPLPQIAPRKHCIWLLYLLNYNLSVTGAVGFIALAGVSAEFGVIMLLYLKSAWNDRIEQGKTST
jgi:Cu(I)/Ag(I) efflux system membrane protein CusA/SilA